MTFSLSETNIIVTDLHAARQFYVETLGFEEVEEDSGALRLKKDNQYFLLLPVATKATDVNTMQAYSTSAQISFDLQVANIHEAHAFLKNNGYRTQPNALQPDSQYFAVLDPDGNALEIVQA